MVSGNAAMISRNHKPTFPSCSSQESSQRRERIIRHGVATMESEHQRPDLEGGRCVCLPRSPRIRCDHHARA